MIIILLSNMGNILNASSDQPNDHTSLQLKIIIDLNKPVHQEVKQLLSWSLQQIRDIYAPFRKRKSSPLLTRSEFLRFVRLSRVAAFHIYDQLCKNDMINAFEVMAILIMTAFTTYTYKVQFMFNVFDLLSTKTLKFSDLILMFKSVVRGFAFLTKQPMPNVQLLQKYAITIFARADLNNDQILSLPQIIAWFQENRDASQMFKRFEPKSYGKEQYQIFNGFCPYKQEEIDLLLTRVKKCHNKQKLQNQDYQLLKFSERLPRNVFGNKENVFSLTSPQVVMGKSKTSRNDEEHNQSGFINKSQKISIFHRKSNSLLPTNEKTSQIKLPHFNSNLSSYVQSSECTANTKLKKGHFSNIIIIKGRTITKRQIFELRDYFDRLSGGKQVMLMQDFIESFNQEKYNHMKSVAASLYNFLDHGQNGRVSFKELLLKLYPNLTAHHIITIDRWCGQYNINFNIKNQIHFSQQRDQTKKRVLPKSCLPRFKEMFMFYDRDKKGFINLDDMRKVLSEVCPQKEILQLFQESDKDRDGKLSLQEFANVILPVDLQIEGLQ